MQEQLISFKTAKLAKEKGFDENCAEGFSFENCTKTGYFNVEGGLFCNSELAIHQYTAPTQSLLQKWLRDIYNIEVFVYRTMKTINGYRYGCVGERWLDEETTEYLFNVYANKEYEDALEVGLYEALKLIK
jgi:hypothetical protein